MVTGVVGLSAGFYDWVGVGMNYLGEVDTCFKGVRIILSVCKDGFGYTIDSSLFRSHYGQIN